MLSSYQCLWCGATRPVKRGAARYFCPGHDAKLLSAINRIGRGDWEPGVIPLLATLYVLDRQHIYFKELTREQRTALSWRLLLDVPGD